MSNPIILRAQAARRFRLAKGAASPRLADELEALGRARAVLTFEEVRFARDSPLEGDGFEPPVPRHESRP
jgi:hypothetical protein